ncbi:hypothetical protein [Virgibacillus ihumii]|uniref:hypothetical protein n=1 Tax=Virgibacillus ihumii TaxID=2686091 RepID=UPI00157C1620|nr:hypothetical protein [Virgibacillus ihumii]
MKKAMSLLAFIFIVIFIIGSFPSITSACSCAELPSVEEEFERSKAVFSGKVVDIKEKWSLRGYTPKSVLFEVTNTWKGVEQSQIIITTGQGGGDCGYKFTQGKEYLVYANESTMYGAKTLVSTMCDRTDVLSSSQDLEVLGEGKPPTEEVDLSAEHNGNQIYIRATVVVAIGIIMLFILVRRKKLN